MSAAALALLMLTGTFQATWADLGRSYDVPPLVLDVSGLGDAGELALMVGLDTQGRAMVTADPRLAELTPSQIRKTAAHEAFHAMLRARGVQYMNEWEERLANAFAYCWIGAPGYDPVVPCDAMLKAAW